MVQGRAILTMADQ